MPEFESKIVYPTKQDEQFASIVQGLIRLSDQGKTAHCRRCQMRYLHKGANPPCKDSCTSKMIHHRAISVGLARKAGNTLRMITFLNLHYPGSYIYIGPNELIVNKYKAAGATRVGYWCDAELDISGTSVVVIDPQAHFRGVCKVHLFNQINSMTQQPIIILVGV